MLIVKPLQLIALFQMQSNNQIEQEMKSEINTEEEMKSEQHMFERIIQNYNYDAITSYISSKKGELSLLQLQFIYQYDKDMIDEIIHKCNYKPSSEVIKLFKRDELTVELLQRLLNAGMPLDKFLIKNIIENDSLDLFKYLVVNYPRTFNRKPFQKIVWNCAFNYGFLDIVEFIFYAIRNQLLELTIEDAKYAVFENQKFLIEKSHFHILEYVVKTFNDERITGTEWFTVEELENSIEHCDQHMFSFIYENTDFYSENMVDINNNLIDISKDNGKSDIYQYMFNKINSIEETKYSESTIFDLIKEFINNRRIDFATFLIEIFIARFNKFPSISTSTVLSTNNLDFIKFYVSNNKHITYSQNYMIVRWIEINRISFNINDILYQKVLKNEIVDQTTYPHIFTSIISQIAEVNEPIQELKNIIYEDISLLIKEYLADIGKVWSSKYEQIMN